MMENKEEYIRGFRVTYYDEWLDIENFETIKADSSEEAAQIWKEECKRDDSQEITSIEESFAVSKTKIERTLGDTDLSILS